jgi:hypothetical protein
MSQPSRRSIWLELQIDPNDPELLAILDQLVRSGLLEHAQIRQLASTCLSEDIPWTLLAPAVATIAPDAPVRSIPAKIPSPVQTIWQSLKDELSVRWLLFLGVFLVILSSGVLAATQWSRFPAWGQYGLLWLYTIGFWVVGGWARRQEGLRLTANTLQVVTLLLIPVNFWAIDSFQLWHQPLELVAAIVAGGGLAGIIYLKQQQRRGKSDADRSGLLLVTYLVLSCLHLGWQIPYWSAIAIYIGAIGVAIVLQKIRQMEGGALAIYGLGMLLLRGLVVEHLSVSRFGLAIGIVGWLFTQWGLQKHRRLARLQQVSNVYAASIRTARYQTTLTDLARLYQQIGASFLMLGWLMGVGDWLSVPKGSSWQVVAVSCLGLVWIWQRLRSSQQQRETIALFFVGLQTYLVSGFLWEPFSNDTLFAKIVPLLTFLFGQNYIIASSLLIFPYLLLWVWLTAWWWRTGWHSLSRTGESLILWTGAVLPIVNIGTPLSLLLDLLASTAILAHLTLRSLPVRSSYIYLTHLTGLATIAAALVYRWDWCRSIASTFVGVAGTNNSLVLDLTIVAIASSILSVGELWLSAQPTRRESDGWLHSAWDIGIGLAMFAYGCFIMLSTFPAARSISPLWWSIVPVAFTYVAVHKSPLQPWQLANQTPAAWYAIGGLGAGLLLTIDRSEWRSILLVLSVGLMFPLVNRLKQISVAAIQIGFGLGLGVNLLAGRIYPISYWLVIGALTIGGLWMISQKLPRIYAVASDRWAIGLAGLGLSIGSINYLYNELSWLHDKNFISIDSQGLDSLQSTLATGSIPWFESIHFITLLATGILVVGMRSRRRWRDASIPATTWFWGWIWTIQIGIAALVHLLGGNTLALAIVNVLLAFPIWFWTNREIGVGSREVGGGSGGDIFDSQYFVATAPIDRGSDFDRHSQKLLPVIISGWGLLLRLPFFTSYTGLLTIAVGVVGVLTSRRLSHQSIGYGGMLMVTLGGYELVTHYILQAPPGGSIVDALTVYGFVTAVLALSYRLGVWWRSRQGADRWWGFPLQDLKNVAHIHWAVASTWKLAAATTPSVVIPQLTLLHLFISVLLGIYALIQARDRDRRDWWIYLGLAELLGVGVYARSIFQNLGIVDEGLILLACSIGLLVLLAPWRQWGWHDRPWRMAALGLPLSRVVFELDRISLLNLVVLAVFYTGVARRECQFGWAYLSLVFVNWAGMRLLFQYHITSPLWYATLVGLSILAAVQWDPYWQKSKQNRHQGRLLGSGIIAVTALVWHQPWLPIGIGLAIAIIGLMLRVRAWLYVGTIVFLLTNTYQLLLLITEYPITKWAIGLLAGVLIITLAANFERRREQIERAWQHWLDRLQEWE